MKNRLFSYIAVLGLLAAVGPLAVDMSLPTLPMIARDLNSTAGAVQKTLTAYFITLGLAQLAYGPWSDQVGRKPPLYLGMCLFLAGTFLCVVAGSIEWLTLGRIVQASGAAAVFVIPRAVVRDLCTGTQATQVMALIMLIISLSPMITPMLGSFVATELSWRAVFSCIGLAGALALALTRRNLTETLPKAARVPFCRRSALRGLRDLLGDRRFVFMTLIAGLGTSGYLVFLSSASFVFMDHFGLSPRGFALAVAANALGFSLVSLCAALVGRWLGIARTLLIGTTGYVAMLGFLCLQASWGELLVLQLVFVLMIGNAFMGLVIPTSLALALDRQGASAGLAASLSGTFQMIMAGVMIAGTSGFTDGSPEMLVVAMAICATLTLTAALMYRLRQNRSPLAPQPTKPVM